MREQPNAARLIAAVAQFLRHEAAPGLNGRLAFHARVAANALDIVERELRLGPAAEQAEIARLRALLGQDDTADAMNRALCEHLASGRPDPGDPALLAHLWRTTLDTLAIDQPKYATYRSVCSAVDAGPGAPP